MRHTACLFAAVVVTLSACATDGVRMPSVGMPNIPGLSGGQLSDVEQIGLVLDDVQRGMESRRIFRVVSHLSRNYSDSEGRDYDAMTAYLNDIFDRYRNIRIRRARPVVTVQGNRAQAVETFGTMADPVDPNRDVAIRLQGQMTVHLEKIGDRWFIREWGRML